MRAITISLPTLSDVSELDARILLAGELYERGRLSLGHAAEVAGLSKRAFIEIMGKYGFSRFNAPDADYLNDVKQAWKQS
ncbi:MAG: UPF0175 family protein [Saprospiraceae bacterium]